MQVVQAGLRIGFLAVSTFLTLAAQLYFPSTSHQAVCQQGNLKAIKTAAQRLQMCDILQKLHQTVTSGC